MAVIGTGNLNRVVIRTVARSQRIDTSTVSVHPATNTNSVPVVSAQKTICTPKAALAAIANVANIVERKRITYVRLVCDMCTKTVNRGRNIWLYADRVRPVADHTSRAASVWAIAALVISIGGGMDANGRSDCGKPNTGVSAVSRQSTK